MKEVKKRIAKASWAFRVLVQGQESVSILMYSTVVLATLLQGSEHRLQSGHYWETESVSKQVRERGFEHLCRMAEDEAH